MNEAKIRLSQEEKELVLNADWILTKNHIMQKIQHVLGSLIEDQTNELRKLSSLPEEIVKIAPKISRGENYQGLPWMVLDHPRCFGKEDVFAIRTMFWWGRFFSCTLQLSGKFKEQFASKLMSAYQLLAKENVYCCVHDEQWQHHFEKDNYSLISSIDEKAFQKIIAEKKFIKLATKIPLGDWDQIDQILIKNFQFFFQLVP